MKRALHDVIIAVLLLVYIAPATALDKVTLQLSWQHQFQFAGYYIAQEKGYYRAAGLDVQFAEAQPSQDTVDAVLSGKAQYGIGNSGLLLQRSAGKPVVALAVVFQHSPYVLLAQRNNAIQSAHDLLGKRVMIEPAADELRAYLLQAGVAMDHIIRAPHEFNPEGFIKGEVDAVSAYVTDEPFYLEKAHFPYQVFSPRSGGIDFYGDNLFTTEQELKRHAYRSKAFREASLRGWRYALAHPEETADLILAKYSRRHDRAHLLYEAKQMQRLIHPELIEVGYMNPGRWRHIAETYAELGMMGREFSLDGFLYEPNPQRQLGWLYKGLAAALLLSLVAWAVVWRFAKLASAARASEEHFRSAVDFSAIGMALVGLDGRWIKVNNAMSSVLGYSPEELMQRTIQDITPKKDLENDMRQVWELLENKQQSIQVEKSFIHRQGHVVETQLHVSLVRDEQGAARYFVVQAQDIGERKLLQLQQVELVLEASPDIVLLVEPQGRIKYANRAAAEALQYRVEELVGLGIEAVVPVRSRANPHRTGLPMVRQSRANTPMEELYAIRKDKTEFPVEISRSALTMEQQPMLILNMVDISTRKRIEQEHQELLEFIQTIVAKSDAGIMVYLATGECVLCNDAAASILGTNVDELGRHNFRQSPSWKQYGLLKVAEATLSNGEMQQHVAQMRTIYGKEIWLSASFSRIVRNNAPHLLTVFTDIAAYKAAEENMREARDLAEAALARALNAERRIIDISEETLQRIGRELHDDLGQHLTGVAFLAETLYQDLSNNNQPEMQMAAKVTSLINDAVSQVRQLSHGLYPVELKEAGLKAMLGSLVANTHAIYAVECYFHDDETWQVHDLDVAINLYRITQEALNNAIKHGAANRIDISLRTTTHAHELEIADNGRGMEQTQAPEKPGLGMHTMHYRASLIGASLRVEGNSRSAGVDKRSGLVVVVSVPFK